MRDLYIDVSYLTPKARHNFGYDLEMNTGCRDVVVGGGMEGIVIANNKDHFFITGCRIHNNAIDIDFFKKIYNKQLFILEENMKKGTVIT